MSYEPPSPPTNLPTELVNRLNESSPNRLEDIASYADALADHKKRKDRINQQSEDIDNEERPKDLPDDVPAKATITIKEINGNRYYYWQWRDGEKIRSQYKSPVNADE